jgi:hypothetical protein
MTPRNKLAKLELTRPNPGADLMQLDLSPDLCAQINAAKLAGTYSRSLSAAAMMSIVAAANKIRAWA